LKAMNPEVRIIGSSGFATHGGNAESVGSEAQYFLHKPYTTETLLATLRAAVHGEVQPEQP
ncbi:MAG: hypothetical protein ABI877_17590, partial [Gemmatimonadaceae bacterium]